MHITSRNRSPLLPSRRGAGGEVFQHRYPIIHQFNIFKRKVSLLLFSFIFQMRVLCCTNFKTILINLYANQ